MFEEVKSIIRERLSAGSKKDEVLAELHEAGYPEDIALQIYNEVAVDDAKPIPAFNQETELPTEISHEAEAVVVSIDKKVDTVTTEIKSKKAILPLVAMGFAAFVLMGGVAYGAATGGFTKFGQYISSLFQSAPYATESELIVGMILSTNEKQAYPFKVNYEFIFEPRASSTLMLKNELGSEYDSDLAELEENIPMEGHAKLGASGLIDNRDKEHPKFDANFNLDFLMEPFVANANIDLKMTESSLYGRINDFPASMQMFIPEAIELKKWILISNNLASSSSDNLMQTFPANFLQVFNATSSTLAELPSEQLAGVRDVFELLTFHEDTINFEQMAAVTESASPLIETAEDKEQTEVRQKAFALIEEYPIFKFVGEPQKVVIDNENLFQYEVDIDYNNLLAFETGLIELTGQLKGEDQSEIADLKNLLNEEIPEREIFDAINRLTDIKITIRKDGSAQGLFIGSTFTLDEKSTSQLNAKFEIILGKEDESLNISAPNDVNPKSLEDIMNESMQESITLANDASLKSDLNYMSVSADIFYEENDSSYLNFCSDFKNDIYFSDIDFECVDTKGNYLIYVPLEVSAGYYCADHGGEVVEIMTEPDLKNMKCISE